MRLLYISTNRNTLSHLNENIFSAFRKADNELENFSIGRLYFNKNLKHNQEKFLKKVKQFQPDIVISFLRYHLPLPNHFVESMKQLKIPVGLWLVNDPYHLKEHNKYAEPYDFIITQEESCIPFYEKKGKKTFHVPLATNTKNYHPLIVTKNYKYDLCFIGNAWPGREEFIDQISPYLKRKKFIIIGKGWETLKNFNELKHSILNNKTIPPTEVAKYYNGSKIVLNIQRKHNDVNSNFLNLPANTPNNRTFDIAACKSFQLIDCRNTLNKYYEIGKEIVCFHDSTDFVKKMDYYLAHAEERKMIATKAYERTLRSHNYENRIRKIVNELIEYENNFKN